MTSSSMFALRASGILLVCGSTIALPACAETSRSPATHAANANSKAPMRSAAPLKANGSGVDVQFRIDGTSRVGEPLRIMLGFAGTATQSGASVRFEADSGLLLPESYRQAIPVSGDGAALPQMVMVTPTAEGLSYLHVFTTQNGVTSVSSIPVQTGTTGVRKPDANLRSTPDGDVLKTMPVK